MWYKQTKLTEEIEGGIVKHQKQKQFDTETEQKYVFNALL